MFPNNYTLKYIDNKYFFSIIGIIKLYSQTVKKVTISIQYTSYNKRWLKFYALSFVVSHILSLILHIQ